MKSKQKQTNHLEKHALPGSPIVVVVNQHSTQRAQEDCRSYEENAHHKQSNARRAASRLKPTSAGTTRHLVVVRVIGWDETMAPGAGRTFPFNGRDGRNVVVVDNATGREGYRDEEGQEGHARFLKKKSEKERARRRDAGKTIRQKTLQEKGLRILPSGNVGGAGRAKRTKKKKRRGREGAPEHVLMLACDTARYENYLSRLMT